MKKHLINILTTIVIATSSVLAQTPGTIDSTLNAGTAQNFTLRKTAIQADGKILIGGSFGGFNGFLQSYLIRLNTNGSIDTTFKIGKGPSADVFDIVVQPDGKIIVVGYFYYFNNILNRSVIRLNADGSIDPTFNANAPHLGTFYCAALQPDGKILLGGAINNYNGYSCRNIIRLKANGSIDSSFVTNDFLGTVYSIAVQDDKKIVVASSTYDPLFTTNLVARLNEDGREDFDFDRSQKISGMINQIRIQQDGKILVAGGGRLDVASQLLIRLKTNGTLDSTFSLGAGTKGQINSFSIDNEGKIVVSGDFILSGGSNSIGVARINQDGSIDNKFQNLSLGTETWALTNSLQSDGKIIVSGNYVQDGKGYYFFYRLNGGNTTTGIENDLHQSFSIYPNPVIESISVSEFTSILDLNGKVVAQGISTINMAHLPSGRYIAKQKNNLFHIVKK